MFIKSIVKSFKPVLKCQASYFRHFFHPFNHIILVFLTFSMLCGCAAFLAPAAVTVVGTYAIKEESIGETIDEKTISIKIRKAFIRAGFKTLYSKINVEVIRRHVLLTGFVQSQEDMLKAVEMAWSVKGVEKVINELRIDEKNSSFTASRYIKDSWITTRIKTKSIFAQNINFVNYTVVTLDGIVYLFGLAKSEEEMEKICQIASLVKGVKKVISYIRVIENNEHYQDN